MQTEYPPTSLAYLTNYLGLSYLESWCYIQEKGSEFPLALQMLNLCKV